MIPASSPARRPGPGPGPRLGLGALALGLLAAGCNGGDDNRRVGIVDGASAKFAQQCSAANPYRNDVGGTRAGSLTVEKQWVRAFFDENYLWYDEVPTVNQNDAAYSNETPGGYYTSIDNYFDALRTPNRTASGALKDKFSFTFPTLDYNRRTQDGVVSGYGINYARYKNDSPNRDWRVAYLEPNSPAATAGLRRGDRLSTVDGVDFICANGAATPKPECATDAGVARLNAGISPAANTSHTFTYLRPDASGTGTGTTVSVTMTAASVTTTPVPIAKVLTTTDNKKVGYILFNQHIVTAERQLRDAVTGFQNQGGIDDLVLDVRYNGGGFLYIASQLAYMIGGTRTYNGNTSKIFEQTQYNRKIGNDEPTPFRRTACELNASFNCTSGAALPALSLPRVYILTTGNTCSASEAIINGLRGVDVDVRLIGGTTCGKPYGFTQKDNCGVSYFPIEFKGVNNKGFGDYSDGFLPGGTGATQDNVPGCRVADDLSKPLGDPAEGMLAATLNYRLTGACPANTGTAADGQARAKALSLDPQPTLELGPERSNRILLDLKG